MEQKIQKINFKRIINGLILIIGIGILAHLLFLVYTVKEDLSEPLGKLKWYILAALAVLAFTPTVIHALRLYIWCRFVSHPLSFKDTLSIIISNELGSALTPTVIGGGPVKLAMLISKGMAGSKATFLVLLSTLEDIVFYALGIGLSVYYMQDYLALIVNRILDHDWILYSLLGLVLLSVLLSRLGIHPFLYLLKLFPVKWQEFLTRVRQNLRSSLGKIGSAFADIWKKGKLTFLLSLSLLIVQWAAKFTVLAIILYSMGIDFTLFEVYIKQWIVFMGMLFVPTPGASGGAEAAFILVFGDVVSGDLLKVIMSLWRFFTYFFMMFLSVVVFQFIGRLK